MSETEREYLARYDIHHYDVPLTTVDLCIFSLGENALQILLVKRAEHPFQGRWALPGGFIDVRRDSDLEATARRVLDAETGLDSPYLEQLETVGNTRRDPRGWSVTVVYFALVSPEVTHTRARHVSEARWFAVDEAQQLSLAFDHALLLTHALTRLRNKAGYSTLPVHVMPPVFTLAELQRAYEILMGRKVDRKAFRRRIEASGLLEETGEMRREKTRPARLYRVRPGMETHFYARSI